MIPLRELVSSEAARRYDDNGDPMYTPAERILMALRWFDWCDQASLMDAIGVERDDRNRYSSALSRLVKRGHLERRGREYRLTGGRAVRHTPAPPPLECATCDGEPVEGRKICQVCIDALPGKKRQQNAACKRRRRVA